MSATRRDPLHFISEDTSSQELNRALGEFLRAMQSVQSTTWVGRFVSHWAKLPLIGGAFTALQSYQDSSDPSDYFYSYRQLSAFFSGLVAGALTQVLMQAKSIYSHRIQINEFLNAWFLALGQGDSIKSSLVLDVFIKFKQLVQLNIIPAEAVPTELSQKMIQLERLMAGLVVASVEASDVFDFSRHPTSVESEPKQSEGVITNHLKSGPDELGVTASSPEVVGAAPMTIEYDEFDGSGDELEKLDQALGAQAAVEQEIFVAVRFDGYDESDLDTLLVRYEKSFTSMFKADTETSDSYLLETFVDILEKLNKQPAMPTESYTVKRLQVMAALNGLQESIEARRRLAASAAHAEPSVEVVQSNQPVVADGNKISAVAEVAAFVGYCEEDLDALAIAYEQQYKSQYKDKDATQQAALVVILEPICKKLGMEDVVEETSRSVKRLDLLGKIAHMMALIHKAQSNNPFALACVEQAIKAKRAFLALVRNDVTRAAEVQKMLDRSKELRASLQVSVAPVAAVPQSSTPFAAAMEMLSNPARSAQLLRDLEREGHHQEAAQLREQLNNPFLQQMLQNPGMMQTMAASFGQFMGIGGVSQ